MTFQLQTFQGVRPALFNYNSAGPPGGYADFDNFTVGAPRVAGIEREIPMGKSIALTSNADGSFLSADTQTNSLVNVAAATDGEGGAAPVNARFRLYDLGLGRVALKAADGKVVSVSDGGAVTLKDLGDAKPGAAETFQWVTLMRGDVMLMSLDLLRFLANALGVIYPRCLGRGFEARAIQQALHQHFKVPIDAGA